MTHQSQVTQLGISYEAVFFSSETVPGETFHCSKRFAVVQEEGPAEYLLDKEPDPPSPEIQKLTTPPSSPGEPIEDDIFNAFNWEEDNALVRYKGLEVDI